MVHDAWRLVRYHKEGLEEGPLQVYNSGLVFSPKQSMVRKLFSEEEPKWMALKPRVENEWSKCLQTLEVHGSIVNSVAFSLDGKLVVLGSYDGTIKLWDTATGVCERTLEGHSHWVSSIAFSPDGKLVASGSYDRTIKLWDIATGECKRTIETPQDVSSMLFSSSGDQLNTDQGTFSISLGVLKTSSAPAGGSSFSVGGGWVLRDGQRLLWLPPEYRPRTLAANWGTLAIGCNSRCVLLMRFLEDQG